MALINCPECNKEISDKSDVCIHCGYKINNHSNSEMVISSKIPLVTAILYTIFVFIGMADYLGGIWDVIMLMIGIGMIVILGTGDKFGEKIKKYLFGAIYLIGCFIIAFENNILSIDLDGNFFSQYVYSGTTSSLLVLFQIVVVISMILFLMIELIPQLKKTIVSIMLFIASILGFILDIYSEIILARHFGGFRSSSILSGLTIFFFFITGAFYVLTLNKKE